MGQAEGRPVEGAGFAAPATGVAGGAPAATAGLPPQYGGLGLGSVGGVEAEDAPAAPQNPHDATPVGPGVDAAPLTASDMPTPQVILNARFMSLSPSPCAPPLWDQRAPGDKDSAVGLGSHPRGTIANATVSNTSVTSSSMKTTASTVAAAAAGTPPRYGKEHKAGRLGLVHREASTAGAAAQPQAQGAHVGNAGLKRVTFSSIPRHSEGGPAAAATPDAVARGPSAGAGSILSPSPAHTASPMAATAPLYTAGRPAGAPRRASSVFASASATRRTRRAGSARGASLDAAHELMQAKARIVQQHHSTRYYMRYLASAFVDELKAFYSAEKAAREEVAADARVAYTALRDSAHTEGIALRMKEAAQAARAEDDEEEEEGAKISGPDTHPAEASASESDESIDARARARRIGVERALLALQLAVARVDAVEVEH